MNKYTEIIDKYLNGELNSEEKKEFERNLESNAALRSEVETQKQLLKGIERSGLRSEIKKGFKKGSYKIKTGKWFMGIVIATLAVSSLWLVKNKFLSENDQNIRYELNEENKKQWSEADKQLSPEIFTIRGDNDTVIETKGGIILTIPANAFLNKGNAISGDIEIEIKEAFDPFEIMKAGLSTTSDGKLLETGGMFYINAKENGNNLTIAQNKGVYASIPDKNPGKDMMLFDGKRMADGQINWVAPKPFENKLHAVDILSLNFYPPHFLDSLKSMGINIKNKKLTDSIYYSFTCGPESEGWATHDEFFNDYDNETKTVITQAQKNAMELRASQVADSIANAITIAMNSGKFDMEPMTNDSTVSEFQHSYCEIAPSRIHAIWNRKFNNTILATKEFEERLQVIFKTCDHKILNLYIKNMDKKMYEIDSMAMNISGNRKEFEDFYKRRMGGLAINESHMKKLQEYMEEKRKIYAEVAAKTMRELYEKENIQNLKASQEISDHNNKESIRLNTVFREELETNMKEAYRQLGKPYKIVYPPSTNYLSITLTTIGWKNVDAYVMESTINRTTLNYTDKESDKKVVIKYEPLTITVSDYSKYDRVVAYLIPNKLSSFQRMPNTGNIFKENLNELFKYGAVVFGFKGEEVYCQPLAEAIPGEKSLSLRKMSKAEMEQYRNMNAGAAIDLVSELNHQLFEQKEAVRKKAIAKREELRNRLWPVVFPCDAKQQLPVKMN